MPDIVCHLELEEYEEPVCQNIAIEECQDIYMEVPFLVDDEECEDIPRLECQEVSPSPSEVQLVPCHVHGLIVHGQGESTISRV